MTDARPHFSAVARQMLLHDSGGELSAAACAVSAASVLDRLQQRLAPFLGAAGMRALFARAVKVTLMEFTVLTRVRAATLDEKVNVGESLSEALNSLGSAVAWAAATALFANFLEVTSSLIGERLVLVVLQRAFGDISSVKDQDAVEGPVPGDA